jgi:CBS domain-containing protein
MRVQDVMHQPVLAVPGATPLKDVGALLARHRIGAVPVVDDDGRLLGVVSGTDLLYKERGGRSAGRLARLLEEPAERSKADARTAAEAMTSPAIAVAPSLPIAEAAALMLEKRVHVLVVADEERRPVGVVARGDLVRAFARSDADVRDEICAEVLEQAFGLPPGQVAVSVSNGDVTLAGEVDTDGDAELLAACARRVPGVVSVSASLTWRRHGPSSVPVAEELGAARRPRRAPYHHF